MGTQSHSYRRSQEDKLSPEELERYDRQLRLLGFGIESQLKLKRARVLVVGVGGLGSAAALYLASAGVGLLRIIDDGYVELSNLNRQILYDTGDIGKRKVDVAAKRLRELNPEIEVEALGEKLTEENVREMLSNADLAVDCLDNFRTRFILNDACVELEKPLIHGAIYGAEGRLMTIIPGMGPCLRCLIPHEPTEHDKIPVLGPLPGIVGALEALEAIKVITGLGEPAIGKLIVIDGMDLSFHTIEIKRNPNCPACRKIK
ncbi:MAG: HesA/MoeB/ThiF family protein [Aigarchaeota archaeon]|nr:HesA/MoeB/ThiF family protein [Candidatus Wolframiiraptor gerlachensis]